MTPRDFIARLEASGYGTSHYNPGGICPCWYVTGEESAVEVKDKPGEQWEVFGWCVKELELLGYEVKVEGPIPGVDSTWAVGARINKKPEWIVDESDTATGAARQVLASVLEGK